MHDRKRHDDQERIGNSSHADGFFLGKAHQHGLNFWLFSDFDGVKNGLF
jgi:hypothetical protein